MCKNIQLQASTYTFLPLDNIPFAYGFDLDNFMILLT